MEPILDQAHDTTGAETHRLLTIHEPPAYVKTASHVERCGDASVPAHCYADPYRRRYPCHTNAATWLSSLFFLDACAQGHEKHAGVPRAEQEHIVKRLAEAARHFGIGSDVAKLTEQVKAAYAETAEENLPDDVFAYVWQHGAKKSRHLPLRNPTEVKEAAAWFNKYRQHFAYPDRRQIAEKILTRAARFDVDISDERETLEKSAGYGYCPNNVVVTFLVKRAEAGRVRRPDLAEEVHRLATIIHHVPLDLRDHTTRCKLAEVVDRYDRSLGLDQAYGTMFTLPEDTLFEITEKQASDYAQRHFALLNGTVYEKAALTCIPPETLRKWFDDTFVDEVTNVTGEVDVEKLAALAASLPRDDADIFDRMTATLGIPAEGRTKAAEAPYGLRSFMADIAALEEK